MRPALNTAVYRFYLNDGIYYWVERISPVIDLQRWRQPPVVGIPAV